jgi:anhydro-N-acetylmuramic acid kinase
MQRSPLDILTRLVTKPNRLICGIMTGTSVDAIDIAIARIHGGGTATRLELLHFSETLFTEELQNRIFANSEVASSNVNDICLLHTGLAHVYAAAVKNSCQTLGIEVGDLDLIGMHGQTIRHLPGAIDIGGFEIRSTLQIGSGSTLATLLQLPVVYDFRAGDMALGGQGAPLVPYVDYLLLHSDEEHRVFLNIGGVANVTIMPRGGTSDEVIAFDTGPGNILVDALMRKYHGREYDEDGQVARAGTVNPDLLSWLLQHPYYRVQPPKSCGRELFGEDYLHDFLNLARDLSVASTEDIIATAAETTVRSISTQLAPFVHDWNHFHLLVSGGGARNRYFTSGLHHAFAHARAETTAEVGIDPDAKEALAFAVLANEWLMGNPANLPSVTGAKRRALLGVFALPA